MSEDTWHLFFDLYANRFMQAIYSHRRQEISPMRDPVTKTSLNGIFLSLVDYEFVYPLKIF
jgi:hypothetical protein